MIKVYVKKNSGFEISSPKIKQKLKDALKKEGVVSDADVGVILVGEREMLALAKKYLNETSLHSVLSFPFIEEKNVFVEPPDNIVHLGEIVVCYPKVVVEAVTEDKLIEEKVFELIEHSALHLLGKHHEE